MQTLFSFSLHQKSSFKSRLSQVDFTLKCNYLFNLKNLSYDLIQTQGKWYLISSKQMVTCPERVLLADNLSKALREMRLTEKFHLYTIFNKFKSVVIKLKKHIFYCTKLPHVQEWCTTLTHTQQLRVKSCSTFLWCVVKSCNLPFNSYIQIAATIGKN